MQLERIRKSFDGKDVISDLTLTINDGEFLTLLGPSGCGKTTVLRLIAGLESVDNGHIHLENQDITQVPAEDRHVNTVFQSYALFPHMTVFENVAYPLKIKKVNRNVIKDKVDRILDVVHLSQYADRIPSQLSGGQQQRVALGRALVAEPELLLLAKKLMATIPFEKVDVLMLEQIGKEISGDGMDPNVVGRAYNYREKPFIHRIGVLDLSPKTGANFNGIGNADATTRRILEKGSFEETYPNGITSITVEYMRIPAMLDNDKLCLQFCIRTCPYLGEPLKVMWTKDTLHMGEFYVSESLLKDVEANPALSTDGTVYQPAFDENDNFTGFQAV